jgi:hypothetical protein
MNPGLNFTMLYVIVQEVREIATKNGNDDRKLAKIYAATP